MERRRLALAAAVVVAWSLPTGSMAHDPPARARGAPVPAPAGRLPVIREAPDFTLVDHEGRRLVRADGEGRVILISFVYLSCPSACPLITQRMALLHQQLRRAGVAPSRVLLLSVTVDPARDDVATLADYARRAGADGRGWRFLRDDAERLRPVLAAFDEWTRPLPGGEIDHPARLHLIDARGRVREIYSLGFFDAGQALLDINALLREGHP